MSTTIRLGELSESDALGGAPTRRSPFFNQDREMLWMRSNVEPDIEEHQHVQTQFNIFRI
jgi:hypothetical protein